MFLTEVGHPQKKNNAGNSVKINTTLISTDFFFDKVLPSCQLVLGYIKDLEYIPSVQRKSIVRSTSITLPKSILSIGLF